MAERARRWEQRYRQQLGISELAERFVERHGETVLDGPLRGLTYPRHLVSSIDAPVAKLIGSYEEELHGPLDDQLGRRPSTFVDIGAADGYYAVGFARLSSQTRVHAFEIAPGARRICLELARANEVEDRLRLHRRATSRALRRLPLEDSFVLSDCEGAEFEIFDDRAVAALRSSHVLIELHEHRRTRVERALAARFGATHSVRIIAARQRDPRAYEALRGWRVDDQKLALAELRPIPGASWAYFQPRS
jgi:precorrin-6B methylase 2